MTALRLHPLNPSDFFTFLDCMPSTEARPRMPSPDAL
nr:MAG TPA: hypothetical protein [Caudoviricetes sp.]